MRGPRRRAALAAACLALWPPLFGTAHGQAPAAQALRLMVIGDSLTAGYGLPAGQAFPAQLEAALRGRGHDVTVLNAGVSGDTSAGGRARIAWALNDRPDAVILELGANDALRGIAPGQLYANLSSILTTLESRGIPTFLSGMVAPPNLGVAYRQEFSDVYRRLAQEFRVPLQPFFLEGVAMNPAFNQADRIHPNAAGVAVMVANIVPLLEPWLATIRRPALYAAP